MAQRKITPPTTEGPYYKLGSPERTQLREQGVRGEELTLSGHVFDTGGKPVVGARLDFWQADGEGRYDNVGFSLRGHQSSGKSGQYVLETVVPKGYEGRTAHIHVKVSPGGTGSTLTTQLFFPGLTSNKTDSIFKEELVIKLTGKTGTFDFILERR